MHNITSNTKVLVNALLEVVQQDARGYCLHKSQSVWLL